MTPRLVLRDPRRQRQVLRAHPDPVDHRPRTRRPSRSRANAVQAGHRQPTSPTAPPSCSRASLDRAAPAPGDWDVEPRPAAGKTGTTDKHNQSLVRRLHPAAGHRGLGRQPQAGQQQRQALTRSTASASVSTAAWPGLRWHVAAPVWSKMMHAASTGMPVKDFPEPRRPRSATATSGRPRRHRRQRRQGQRRARGRRLQRLRRPASVDSSLPVRARWPTPTRHGSAFRGRTHRRCYISHRRPRRQPAAPPTHAATQPKATPTPEATPDPKHDGNRPRDRAQPGRPEQ